MVQLIIAHPTSSAAPSLQSDLSYAFNGSLNPSIYFFIIHTTLLSFPLSDFHPIFTPSYPTLASALTLTQFSHLVPPPRFHFFQSHTNITQVTTQATYIFSIYGVRMPSQDSKPSHIYGNTISKLILRYPSDRNTSAFR